MNRRHKPQRGVVLLIVISLLVLFVLIAVTFTIVAGQYKHAARASARFQMIGDPPRKDLDMVMYSLLRDTGVRSPIQGQSLLADFYGDNELVTGQITGIQSKAGGQFRLISFTAAGTSTFSSQSGFYNGCVLSIISGPAKGFSTLVTGYDPTNLQVQVEAYDSEGTAIPNPSNGDLFLINGRPLNGTGFGYDDAPGGTAPGNIDLQHTTVAGAPPSAKQQVALMPNFAGYATATSKAVNLGGADEPWDAVDANNMILAKVPPSASTASDITPSFVRPDLMAYWIKWLKTNVTTSLTLAETQIVFLLPYGPDLLPGTSDESAAPWSSVPIATRQSIVQLKRQISFRPLAEDHPNFTGSNPSGSVMMASNQTFNLLTGSILNTRGIDRNSNGTLELSEIDMWDVDNDGDGITDSVWIDPGLPVVTAPDGRQYKKLVAVLVRDMDGRINLNAADTLAHTDVNYTNNVSAANAAGNIGVLNNPPRGHGYGPGDFSFAHLFSAGEYSSILTSRYGTDGRPGLANNSDTLFAIKSLGIPNNYTTSPQAFGFPPDVYGQGVVALDFLGQPLTGFMGNGYTGNANETRDNPYEADPMSRQSADAMYTAAELERVLRAGDIDAAGLPSRLALAAPNAFSNSQVRKLITTHSSHSPVPSTYVPFELRQDANFPVTTASSTFRPATLLDIYRGKLRKNGVAVARVDAQLQRIVPWEVLHGQKFDVNRWFGNGIDDNGNNVVDEYNEELTGEQAWSGSTLTAYPATTMSYANDVPGAAAIEPRQLFARHLYCLVRALMDDDFVLPFPNDANAGTLAQQKELTYRRLAQWAINVVDFRDRDAIMTPFEYDVNPFNGWVCDGNPATDEANDGIDNDGDGLMDGMDSKESERRVVWGMEYPDLLVTESFAMHDRRVKDTNLEGASGKFRRGNSKGKGVGMGLRDADLDQYRIPQGSVFFELYCARNMVANNASLPYELYDSATGKLDLGRLAPQRQFGMQPFQHPVWRIAIAKQPRPAGTAMPIHQVGFSGNFPYSAVYEPNAMNSPIERIVWFAPVDPANAPEGALVFWGRSGNVQVAPGQYCVALPRPDTRIGSLDKGADGDPDTAENSPQSIGVNGMTGVFRVAGGAYNTPPNNYPAIGTQIGSPVAVVCAARPPATWSAARRANWLVGMNISEPLPLSAKYYPEPTAGTYGDAYADLTQPWSNMPANETYPEPFDSDVQYAATSPLVNAQYGVQTGTRLNFRTHYLQRLANPLLAWNPLPDDPQFGALYDSNLAPNPYLTIDWGTIDLTVFSGDEDTNQKFNVANGMGMVVGQEWIDPTDEDPFDNVEPLERFRTRERGEPQGMAATDTELWPARAKTPSSSSTQTNDPDLNFDRLFRHTLGYLNSTYGAPQVPAAGYEGAPQTPFPWLTWHNRPFVSPLEMMLVPASEPSRVSTEYRPVATLTDNPFTTLDQIYGHLFNFFHTSNVKASSGGAGTGSMHLYRLFDLIETPSPYAGTEKWYFPTTFANTSLTDAQTFRPPYNRLSRFRDPGRMNINTIFDLREWQALTKGFPAQNSQAFFDRFDQSRRGYNISSYGDYPSLYSNPFRPANAADLMPNVQTMRKQGVESTLLRPDPVTTNRPLFQYASTAAPHENTDRNPYFRYRGITRLNNMVSFHSNVYAMWLTTGYFEVQQGPVDAAHPDGYYLGPEVGLTNGTVERHRAFYLIDRSIPVAYQPGQNHNVDRCVLLRRYIE